MTLLDLLTTLPPDQWPATWTCTADPALQHRAEAAGYVLIAHTLGRRERDPVTGVWVQLGLDTMTLHRAPMEGTS